MGSGLGSLWRARAAGDFCGGVGVIRLQGASDV